MFLDWISLLEENIRYTRNASISSQSRISNKRSKVKIVMINCSGKCREIYKTRIFPNSYKFQGCPRKAINTWNGRSDMWKRPLHISKDVTSPKFRKNGKFSSWRFPYWNDSVYPLANCYRILRETSAHISRVWSWRRRQEVRFYRKSNLAVLTA